MPVDAPRQSVALPLPLPFPVRLVGATAMMRCHWCLLSEVSSSTTAHSAARDASETRTAGRSGTAPICCGPVGPCSSRIHLQFARSGHLLAKVSTAATMRLKSCVNSTKHSSTRTDANRSCPVETSIHESGLRSNQTDTEPARLAQALHLLPDARDIIC